MQAPSWNVLKGTLNPIHTKILQMKTHFYLYVHLSYLLTTKQLRSMPLTVAYIVSITIMQSWLYICISVRQSDSLAEVISIFIGCIIKQESGSSRYHVLGVRKYFKIRIIWLSVELFRTIRSHFVNFIARMWSAPVLLLAGKNKNGSIFYWN